MPRTFRFRPRLRAFPYVVMAVGLAVLGIALLGGLTGFARTFAIVCGVLGPLLGVLYLVSPAWQLAVVVDDEALAVMRGSELRFRLPWGEVQRVVHAPATRTCFVDGGSPERSLLVPGPGAPGPYRIEGREALYDLIVARVPADRQHEVPSLEAPRPK